MIKTRFEQSKLWLTGSRCHIQIVDMETPHLLNAIKMIIMRPDIVQAMLVTDIEHNTIFNAVWSATDFDDNRKESLYNVTSLNNEQLVDYVCESPLFKAMVQQLEERGVNVNNVLNMLLPNRNPA